MNRVKIIGIMAAVFVLGCDTVAELTFEEEQALELVPGAMMDAHCGSEGDDAVWTFSVLTSFDRRLTPGRRYAALHDTLRPSENFTANDISFGNAWLFEVGSDGRDRSCSSASDCSSGALCVTPSQMGLQSYYYAPAAVCAFEVSLKPNGDPRFVHYRTNVLPDHPLVQSARADGRSISFILDNSATLDGSALTGIPDDSSATDPYQYRKVALNQFMDALRVTDESTPKYEFAAWFANGTGDTGVYDISENWLRTFAAWERVVMTNYPTPSGESPLWETGNAAVAKVMNSANTAYRKTIVSLSDGPANGASQEAQDTFMKQMTMAAKANVDLHWIDFSPTGEWSLAFADAVKLSCGGYYRIDTASQMPEIMRQIAVNTESEWRVGLKFPESLPSDMYRLAATIVVKIGDSAVAYEAQRVQTSGEAVDRRIVVFR